MDREVWNEFYENWDEMYYQNEILSLQTQNKTIENPIDEFTDLPPGRTRTALVQQRVNQQFFRQSVLASYNLKCCVTG